MSVRPAAPGDAGAIADIWNRHIRETTVTFTTEAKTVAGIAADIGARPGAFFVAGEGRAVAGFATAFAFRGGPGYRHTMEHTVQIAPQARGRGLGRALMTRLEAAVRERGCHVLVAAVSGENADAAAFHAALGFEAVGRMPQVGTKFGRWMDLILMQKILGSGGGSR